MNIVDIEDVELKKNAKVNEKNKEVDDNKIASHNFFILSFILYSSQLEKNLYLHQIK
jgi:hypothetical protein